LKVRDFLFRIIYFMFGLALFFAIVIMLAFIQEKLLIPQDYIMWIFKSPVSRLVFIFDFYFISLLFKEIRVLTIQFAKRHKKWTYPIFMIANLMLLYALLFNVSVITQNGIINHSFLVPQGKVYNFSDVINIDTGVYGKQRYIPLTHSSGQFYYIITLNDGTKIDLNGDAGGTQNDKDMNEVFEEIDNTLVSMGIKKTAKINNFGLLEKRMDKVYSDRIKNVLTNIK
jgi:hypothetical protein